MGELIQVLQDINNSLIGIRFSIEAIGLYLLFMLFFKDMGNGAKEGLKEVAKELKEKLGRKQF